MAPTYQYTAIQFSPRRELNTESAKTGYVCYVCGRDIDPTRDHYMVHVIHGGPDALHPAGEEAWALTQDRGDLGLQPVGPTCMRGLSGYGIKVGPINPAHYAAYGIK